MKTARSQEKTSDQRSANYFARALVALGIAAAGTFGSAGIASAESIGSDRPGVSADDRTKYRDSAKPKFRSPHSSAPHLTESAAAKARKAHIPHHPAWDAPLAGARG